MKLVNLDNGNVLAQQVQLADRFFTRLRGLMFSQPLPSDHCLHILPCQTVHTHFMNFSIDILHLNAKNHIVGMEKDVQPGNLGKKFPGTKSIVEFLAGRLEETQTKIGHAVQFTYEKERF